MATNDRAMVEAASCDRCGEPLITKTKEMEVCGLCKREMHIASEIALAVAAERTRIAVELLIAYPGKGHDGTWLVNFIDKLRGATDE